MRRGADVFLYLNGCPHLGVELNWSPDQFLTVDGSLIQCATHGARFEIDTGRCIAGPCFGEHLVPVPCRVEKGLVVMQVPE